MFSQLERLPRECVADFAVDVDERLDDERQMRAVLRALEKLPRADQDVLLEVLDMADNWAHVKHSDGATGYIRVTQVWGL